MQARIWSIAFPRRTPEASDLPIACPLEFVPWNFEAHVVSESFAENSSGATAGFRLVDEEMPNREVGMHGPDLQERMSFSTYPCTSVRR